MSHNKCDIEVSDHRTVKVTCNCSHLYYQAVLQRFSGTIEDAKNISSERIICSESATFPIYNYGDYHVTVFTNNSKVNGLLYIVYYSRQITVNKANDNIIDITIPGTSISSPNNGKIYVRVEF